MLLPPALGFSPLPPVSVFGTGTYNAIAAFLDSSLFDFATFLRYILRIRISWRLFLPPATSLIPVFALPGSTLVSVSPHF